MNTTSTADLTFTPRDPMKFEKIAAAFLAEFYGPTQPALFYSGRFYKYDGTRYFASDDLTHDLRKYLRKKKVGQSNSLIGNVVPIIQNRVHKSRDKHGNMPFYCGTNVQFPDPNDVIAFKNGLLDVATFLKGSVRLLPHTHCFYNTICLPFAFDPTATCPLWLKFLAQVLEADAERITLLQQWFGYCLTNDLSQHKFMVMYGVPRAGKGTIQRVLEHIVGTENSIGFSLYSLADKFGTSKLLGKSVAFVGEVNLSGNTQRIRIMEQLNSIVGCDPVDIEQKYNPEPMSCRLPTRFMVACNPLPVFHDPSGATSARMLLLHFKKSFQGREDRDLERRLLAEAAGIYNWALAGYRDLREKGRFIEPAHSKVALNEYRRESSETFAFMQDSLVIESRLNPGNLEGISTSDDSLAVWGSELELAWHQWCEINHKDRKYNWLIRDLKDMLPDLTSRRIKNPSDKAGTKDFQYSGISLRQDRPICRLDVSPHVL